MVFLHIALPGSSNSILGNFAVFSKSASDAIFIPGAMVPPRYSAFLDTAQNVVAVPKSIIITGPPYL